MVLFGKMPYYLIGTLVIIEQYALYALCVVPDIHRRHIAVIYYTAYLSRRFFAFYRIAEYQHTVKQIGFDQGEHRVFHISLIGLCQQGIEYCSIGIMCKDLPLDIIQRLAVKIHIGFIYYDAYQRSLFGIIFHIHPPLLQLTLCL